MTSQADDAPGVNRHSATFKRVLLQVHLWIGLILCIPFALLGLTGSILVYDQDIDAMSAPLPQASMVGAPSAPSAILAAAMAGHPDLVAGTLIMPAKPGDPASVRLAREGARNGPPGRGGVQVYVDPVTLAVLGTRTGPRSALLMFAHDLHGNMMLGMPDGRGFVGWLGVGMTILGFSGIVLWWPKKGRWRSAIGMRRGARGFLLYRQWHATAGVVAWIVFVVVSISGVAIAFPLTMGDAVHSVFGGTTGAGPLLARVEPAPGVARIGPDAALAVAAQAAPRARLAMMFLPVRPGDSYRVNMTGLDGLAGAPPITVMVDPYRSRVLAVRDARTGAAGDAILLWQRPLHTGDAFGAVGRFLVFLVGLLPTLFAITGVAMWVSKRRARARMAARRNLVAEGAPAE